MTSTEVFEVQVGTQRSKDKTKKRVVAIIKKTHRRKTKEELEAKQAFLPDVQIKGTGLKLPLQRR